MFNDQQIKAAMKVIDANGLNIGIVARLHENGVELTHDGFGDGLRHFVPLAAVRRVEGDSVIVEPGHATTMEAIDGAILYGRQRSPATAATFGTSGHGTGSGGSGIGD